MDNRRQDLYGGAPYYPGMYERDFHSFPSYDSQEGSYHYQGYQDYDYTSSGFPQTFNSSYDAYNQGCSEDAPINNGFPDFYASSSMPSHEEYNSMYYEPYPQGSSYFDGYGYGPPPQDAQDYRSRIASFNAELEATRRQLERLTQLVSMEPPAPTPSHMREDSDISFKSNGRLERDDEEKVVLQEELKVPVREFKPHIPNSSCLMERMDEPIEQLSVKATPEEHSKTILVNEPLVEVQPQVEVAIIEEYKLQERGEEIVGEIEKLAGKVETAIIEEGKEEEVYVEPPQAEKNEPISSCRLEVEENPKDEENFVKFFHLFEEPHFHQPLVGTTLQIPRCVKLDERLISNKRKMKDLLKKALDGVSMADIYQVKPSKIEETLPEAEEMHRVLKKRRSDPSKLSCMPEQEPNPELSRHAATNSKADERVP